MPENTDTPSQKVQLIELGVFLLLIVPSMVLSFFSFQNGANPPFALFAAASMIQQAALLCLVLYFAWQNKEPFSDFGWKRKNILMEIVIGAALYFPIAYVLGYLQAALKSIGLSTPESVPGYLSPSGPAEYLLAVALFTVVAVSEEGVFRGYLIRRFENLTGRPEFSVVAAAAVFCVGHGYQNFGGVAATFVLGVVFGAVYLWRGSLAAPIVIHFLQNMATVMMATLGR